MVSHPPIPIMDLADHLERLKANDNLKFSQEYEASESQETRMNMCSSKLTIQGGVQRTQAGI